MRNYFKSFLFSVPVFAACFGLAFTGWAAAPLIGAAVLLGGLYGGGFIAKKADFLFSPGAFMAGFVGHFAAMVGISLGISAIADDPNQNLTYQAPSAVHETALGPAKNLSVNGEKLSLAFDNSARMHDQASFDSLQTTEDPCGSDQAWSAPKGASLKPS